MYKFELEKGSKKYHCPACSNKWLVRYVISNTNEHLNSDVGRCDRESKCGYHFTPKMYFVENPQAVAASQTGRIHGQAFINKNGSQAKYEAQVLIQETDYIEKRYLIASLQNYEQNAFVQFLLNLFPDCLDEVQKAVKDYRIGTTPDGKVIFWQIDKNNRTRTGKIIAYDANTGKRRKDVYPNWIHSELKKYKKVGDDFNLKQCFFGEHLLRTYPNKNICIVEAEKTAVIASICYPELVWLAIGSKQMMKFSRIKQIGRNRKIILYPDADGFDVWNKTAQTARSNGFDVSISNLINTNASDKERINGFDLADYLISEQTEINKQNKFIASVNEKLEIVKNDAELFEQFNTILDEQKAVLIIDGQTPELEAERIISNSNNVRSIVLSLF
ncbi:MAG: DUF6371 domain-containing protein [Acidobacteriota bacterium]|jgi:hypothetical protein|nr:DUF6371 domain-containing protein [Acidobacteriota bacterium]